MGILASFQYRPVLTILNIFLIIVMLLGLYALFFAKFIPSDSYYFYSLIIWQPVSIILYFVYFKINTDAKSSIILLPVFMLFFYIAFSIGAPSVINYLVSESETITVTVSKKSKGGYRGNCKYRLNVEELVNTISTALCVTQSGYNKARIGSKIKLSSNKSWFGMHVKNIYI